jgi:hypothetical protein
VIIATPTINRLQKNVTKSYSLCDTAVTNNESIKALTEKSKK